MVAFVMNNPPPPGSPIPVGAITPQGAPILPQATPQPIPAPVIQQPNAPMPQQMPMPVPMGGQSPIVPQSIAPAPMAHPQFGNHPIYNGLPLIRPQGEF